MAEDAGEGEAGLVEDVEDLVEDVVADEGAAPDVLSIKVHLIRWWKSVVS